ncbi:hypothetical protein [Desulfobacula toluolica]|uniref:Conserved uncharacterized protein n=1 Tax=Desulfobacula toluolica (strain DSM 7467 / Tol2) TaxID=651182 RepID=K0NT51_DESTT|nr:hypothetical protein [Desulfobacula toluolica]CCK82222.1 conserved uncharacterized protein [Desulfobacula toluolica Tol2]
MNANQDRLMQLHRNIESIADKLTTVPQIHQDRAEEVIDLCRNCLKNVPSVDTPVYIHITGTDKSFKTSYLLDLFDNDELRKLFSVKMRTTSENTAVPCLVEPSSGVDKVFISQVSISTGRIMRNNLTQNQFNRLYDLSSGAVPDDYLLRVQVPDHATPMTLPVIEYPGIKEGADAMERQKELHRLFQENMMATLVKYPGILVACFQHKIAIPPGHPLDAILKKYGKVLKTNVSYHKLPLVLSLQGESAIASYCGNTNVVQDIQSDFQSYNAFDTLIQLINPCNTDYPVNFVPPGPHVDEWVTNMSRYRNIEEIKEQVLFDGGVSWSRRILKELCATSYVREALDNLFLKPWIMEADVLYSKAMDCYHDIMNYDEVAQIKERIRQAILNESYQPLRQFFEAELGYAHEGIIANHQEFWVTIFSQYLEQFLREADRSKTIAKVMWNTLFKRLDPEKKGFLGTREEDLPYIIMNMAELYVPNALLRGDYTTMERDPEDTTHAV